MANDYTAAVNYLNQADDLGDMLLKTILQALADDNVDVMEYVMIGINGGQAALAAYSLFRPIPLEDRTKILEVLLEGECTRTMSTPGDYTVAIGFLDQARGLLGLVFKSILIALADNKVKPREYIMIGMNGGQAGVAAYNLFQAIPPPERKQLLTVLLHGDRTWTMPDALPPGA